MINDWRGHVGKTGNRCSNEGDPQSKTHFFKFYFIFSPLEQSTAGDSLKY